MNFEEELKYFKDKDIQKEVFKYSGIPLFQYKVHQIMIGDILNCLREYLISQE